MTQSTIFISYSRHDELEKNQLLKHLNILQRSGLGVDLWDEERIMAGMQRTEAIDEALARASVAILLVTVNFLDADAALAEQVSAILARRQAETLTVVPLIARSCAWDMIDWLSPTQVLPKTGQPIWREQGLYVDDELAEITRELNKLLRGKLKNVAPVEVFTMEDTPNGELLYLDNYGKRSSSVPPQAHHLDWTAHFDSRVRPRRVPDPETWAQALLPELRQVEEGLPAPTLIRLRGSASLPAGFAVGHTFLEVGRYQLEVEQISDSIKQPWYSSAQKETVYFSDHLLPGNPEAQEAAVIIFANPKQNLAEVVSAVGRFWGEPEAFTLNAAAGSTSQRLNQILVLEATPAARDKRDLKNWEAASLAKTSAERVRRLIGETQVKKIHLFMAVPLALAVFLGHRWNILNCQVQCYEWVGEAPDYAPACLLSL